MRGHKFDTDDVPHSQQDIQSSFLMQAWFWVLPRQKRRQYSQIFGCDRLLADRFYAMFEKV